MSAVYTPADLQLLRQYLYCCTSFCTSICTFVLGSAPVFVLLVYTLSGQLNLSHMPSFGIRQPKQLDLAVDGRKQLAVETPHLKRTAAYVSLRQHSSASSA